jgi:hypothetical protein
MHASLQTKFAARGTLCRSSGGEGSSSSKQQAAQQFEYGISQKRQTKGSKLCFEPL